MRWLVWALHHTPTRPTLESNPSTPTLVAFPPILSRTAFSSRKPLMQPTTHLPQELLRKTSTNSWCNVWVASKTKRTRWHSSHCSPERTKKDEQWKQLRTHSWSKFYRNYHRQRRRTMLKAKNIRRDIAIITHRPTKVTLNKAQPPTIPFTRKPSSTRVARSLLSLTLYGAEKPDLRRP